MAVRLDKLLASQGTSSRRDVALLIRQGRVTVDGEIVRDPACKTAEDAAITVDGKPFYYHRFVYLMMNKPAGVLCVSSDPKRETVVDLVPAAWRRKDLFPAGRLDRDTVGLVILTNDGDFAHRMLAPKSHVMKTYQAILDAPVGDREIAAFAEGLTLADGTPCLPAHLAVQRNAAPWQVEVQISEGRFHQIKRMFGVVDRGVVWLKRCRIGRLELDENLKPGECRPLTDAEIAAVFAETVEKPCAK